MAGLFSPLDLKGHTIKNRIIFPAMLVCDPEFVLPDGKVNQLYLDHYTWLANSGVGMIVVGAVTVRPDGMMTPNQLGIWSDDFIEGLAKIPEICHKQDVAVLMMINHAGVGTVSSDAPVASSNLERNGKTARMLTKEEIKELQQCYVDAAVRAEKAGYDGIEIQCSHAYLIDTFLSSVMNTRTDEYGGSAENRARFVTEIVQEVKKHVGPGFIVGCRLPCNASTLEDSITIAKLLEKAGMDFFDISWGTISLVDITKGEGLVVPEGYRYGALPYGASQLKKNLSVPVAAVWRIKSTDADALIQEGVADFADVLRGLLVDPDWVEKAQRGEATNECLNCKPICRWFQSRALCPVWTKLDPAKCLNIN